MAENDARLAAVLSADMADYTEWHETDPAGAEQGLARTREALASLARQFHATANDTEGEVLRAAFVNPVDAVACAVALQEAIDAHNEGLDEEDQVDVRAGVALGTVTETEGRIAGAGADAADALRGLAEPGGVRISGAVFEHARGRFAQAFRRSGTRSIAGEEIAVYRFAATDEEPDAGAAPVFETPEERARAQVRRVRHLQRNLLLGGATIVFLLLVNLASSGAAWFQWPALAIAVVLALQALRVVGPEGIAAGARRCRDWARARSDWHRRSEEEMRERLSREGMSERALRRRLRALRSFHKRTATFAVIVGFLFVLNLMTSPGSWWVVWPALGLAFVTAMSAINVYGPEAFVRADWEERKERELREKYEREQH